LLCHLEGFGGAAGDAVGGLADVQFPQDVLEAFPVFGGVDGIGGSAPDLQFRAFQGVEVLLQGDGQLQRRLPAKLDDDALRIFRLDDVKHILFGEGFKVEAIARVVVRRNRFRVRVHHDCLEVIRPQRKGGMATAVVKLNPLPNPVGTTAEDHHLVPFRFQHLRLDLAEGVVAIGQLLVGGFVGGVVVGGEGFKLGGAGVHGFVDGDGRCGPHPR